jgi:hypothetical protein
MRKPFSVVLIAVASLAILCSPFISSRNVAQGSTIEVKDLAPSVLGMGDRLSKAGFEKDLTAWKHPTSNCKSCHHGYSDTVAEPAGKIVAKPCQLQAEAAVHHPGSNCKSCHHP